MKYTLKQQHRARNRYINKNGGIEAIVNNLDTKNKYEKFLTKLLGIKTFSWKQKRSRK